YDYYNTDEYAEFQLAANGKVIIMAIEREDTRGKRDLYAIFRMDPLPEGKQRWTAPIHLGPDINSAGLEMSPFLASDMVTLYFSSNGFPGFGNNDMFVSKRLDESWTRWSEPVNLGPVINSSKLDAYYTIPASGEYAYFASSNKSIGRTDLFSIPLPEDIRPDPVVLIRGKVLEQDVEELNREVPVRASISWSAKETHKSNIQTGDHSGIAGSDPADGKYNIVLPYGHLYEFRAEAEGYFALNETIDLQAIDNYQELEVDLYLIPIRKGEIIPIRDVYFEVNRAVLLDESDRELSRVSTFLTDNSMVTIEIAGHTNNRCSEAFCQQLSDRRAKSVARYLSGRGIDPERITYKGYGSAEPIADNETKDGRALNQRVEFRITSTDGIRTNKKRSGK
ncbi:MAG: OOP family OmpA-OmpF porin, partial [Limisphaerales bacterium]